MRRIVLVALLAGVWACGSGDAGAPTPTGPSNPTLVAPSAVSPVNDEQQSTLRPVFTVQNGTSDVAGTRVYEFQISDRLDFSTSAVSSIRGLFAVVVQTGVAEGTGGRTSFTPAVDLQPTTRMYWRARVTQGGSVSAWSTPVPFRTKLVGFIRDGEVYDPLIHGETVGERVGSTDFLPGVGLRINNQQAYVRYALPRTISSGEFSADVRGLAPNGPDHKLKIFSMSDSTGDLFNSRYQVSTMYRGIDGNPPNCIAFKAVFGGGTPIEPEVQPSARGHSLLESGHHVPLESDVGK